MKKQPISIHGALAHLFDVYHGPTQDGPWQVHVTLRTSDAEGEGRAQAVVDFDPERTPPERIAAIIHEAALSLLAHELLECIGTAEGEPTIDPHAHGELQTVPQVDAPMFRTVSDRLGLSSTCTVSVVVPAWLSYSGKVHRKEAQIDTGVAEIVRRLNHRIFGDQPITEQSCEGHGEGYPYVQLVGGETLLFVPNKDVEKIERLMHRPKLNGSAIGKSGASA